MPACNVTSLTAMALQLQAAVEQQDWQRLGQLDRVLASWLQEASGLSTAASDELQSAWQQVRQAHTHAWHACQQAKAQAAAQLQQLQHSQEAQQAYAWQEVLK